MLIPDVLDLRPHILLITEYQKSNTQQTWRGCYANVANSGTTLHQRSIFSIMHVITYQLMISVSRCYHNEYLTVVGITLHTMPE